MARMSIATIDKPEFINIKPYNPLISECEIKVMYVGENRNRSYISKEVAAEMANSLPGNPIVGYFREDVGDFRDHGELVTIDHEGVHFKCMTKPYGFVAPDAKVWFQKFEETDDFGNVEIKEYLMTTGYLWTGQFPECQVVTEQGRPHSMELDEKTLNGHWAENKKTGMDFFIINDAIFSKLCILGEDVEPCFEGSTVTAPQVSTSFSLDDEFTKTLFDMVQELKFALKGEQNMFEVEMDKEVQSSFAKSDDKEEKKVDETVKETEEDSKQEQDEKEEEKKKFSKEEDEKEDKDSDDSDDKEDEDEKEDKFVKKEEEKEKSQDKEEKSSEDKKEEDEEKEKYSLLVKEYEELKTQYSTLESQFNELLVFKNQIEDEKKDALINSFYMLSDEDKKEVVENKSKFSLDEIEAKLSVICVRKKVSFDLDDNSESKESTTENAITTFSLDSEVTSTPAWVSAVRNIQKSRNI